MEGTITTGKVVCRDTTDKVAEWAMEDKVAELTMVDKADRAVVWAAMAIK